VGEFESFLRSLVKQSAVLPNISVGAIIRPEGHNKEGQSVQLLRPAYDRLVAMITQHPEMIYQIEPRQWEEIIAASYKNAGFDEVVLTPRSGDFGRDVIAYKRGFGSVKFIEQVKAYKPGHIVTAGEVRDLVGALYLEQDVSKAVFSTTSIFAPRLRSDKFLKNLIPTRLELVDCFDLVNRLNSSFGKR
jgi:restriction system protein